VTAHIYCWAPNLQLDPADSNFRDKVRALQGRSKVPPSETLVMFVSDLIARYPDLAETTDTVWGDGPLVGNIIGDFINISLVWSRYEEAAPFIVQTAHKHGLHAYNPQTGDFFPNRIQ